MNKRWIVKLKVIAHKTIGVTGADEDEAFENAESEFQREYGDELTIKDVDDVSIEEDMTENQ